MLTNSQWLRQLVGRGSFQPSITISRGFQRAVSLQQPGCRAYSSKAEGEQSLTPRRRKRSRAGKPSTERRSEPLLEQQTAAPRDTGSKAQAPVEGESQLLTAVPATGPEHCLSDDTALAASPAGDPLPPQSAGPNSTQAGALPLSQRVPLPGRGQPQYADAPFKLRPYQVEAIHTVIKEWKEGGVNAQMVMLPTGCGKTVVFAALARYLSQHYIPPNAAPETQSAAAAGGAAALREASGPQGPGTTKSDPAEASLGSRGNPTVAAASVDSNDTAAAASDQEQPAATKADASGSASARFLQIHGAVGTGTSRGPSAAAGSSSMDSCSSSSSPTNSATMSESEDVCSSSTEVAAAVQASQIKTSKRSKASSKSSTKHTRKSSKVDTSAGTDSVSSSDDDTPSRGSSKGRKSRRQGGTVRGPAGAMRVLVLAHRHELLHQAEEKFRLMWGSEKLAVSWVKGKRKEFGGQVVVASVATAVNCIPALKECDFSLVIVDEAHHTVAASYQSVLQGLGFIEVLKRPDMQAAAQQEQEGQQDSTSAASSTSSSTSPASSSSSSIEEAVSSAEGSYDDDVDEVSAGRRSLDAERTPLVRVLPDPHRLLLGFSATPYRLKVAESRHLYDIFNVTFSRSIADMIRAGHLAEVHSQKVLTQTDLKGAVVGANGDFISSKLSLLVNSRTRNKLVLAAYLEHCTEQATPGHDTGPTVEEQQHHEQLARTRAFAVRAALDRRARKEAQNQQQVGVEVSTAGATEDEVAGGSNAVEEQEETQAEEDEATEIYPLPADISPKNLTGGLSIAGRRPVRKTIAFAVDIKHAEAMNAVFNAAGVRSSAIHSMMPWDMMKGELARFRRGELDVLFNVEVLTEGFDEPSIDAILMARPTRSQGLYTQMLGRGLRVMPGKAGCLVLDFTDRYHQAGKVIDVRVLLPESLSSAGGPVEAPEEKGPSRVDEDATGGEVDLLERSLTSKDLAWRLQGPHCVTSIFSGGNVWLVQTDGMGAKQRHMLGLAAPAPLQQRGPGHAAGAGSDGESEDDEDEDDLQDRYVVLHQTDTKDPDPLSWKTAFKPSGHTWVGLTKEDAFGAALDYMDQYIRQQQVMAVRRAFALRAQPSRGRDKRAYVSMNTFKSDARWRLQPASDKQLQKLKKLQISVDRRLTKGEASDLISDHQCALATWEQRQQLLDYLPPQLLAELPVPLLKARASELLDE